ncbi:MAG: DUF1801 domain-containing protein [Gammaproteobacteria bacterium]|nr:DUF1801 domain-containing protein [Gammaproteobacteria bacterium]
MDAKVEQYLHKLPSPQREICQRLREIILHSFPDIVESFNNGVPWYQDKFYLVGLKNHVNIGFAIQGLSAAELSLFEGKGKLMRHLKIFSVDDIDEDEIVKRLRLVR